MNAPPSRPNAACTMSALLLVLASLAACRDIRTPGFEQIAPAPTALEAATTEETATEETRAAEQSVNPGINEPYLEPDIDPEAWASRFEVESREVYANRVAIADALHLLPGDDIADIGAGTGLFVPLFAERVGPAGTVYAVDIVPAFIAHIDRRARREGLSQVRPWLCAEDSVGLPPHSIDTAFICDTYHHFEYPRSSLASIHDALRPGGRLIVLDFERIPGVSREWILGHVRAGKEVFRAEIEAAGFDFEDELDIAGLEENYVLRFRKPQ